MCFRMIGFNREAAIKNPAVLRLIHKLIAFVIFLVIIVEAFFIATHLDDLLASAECFGPLSIEIITLSKFVTFFIYENKFYQLMDKVGTLSNQLTLNELFVIEKVSKLEKRFTLVYLVSAIVTGVTLCVAPILASVINHAESIELPVKAVFPYNTTNSPAFELTFTILSFATYVTVFTCVSS